jgi:flavin-dependent dehydrogenase
MKMEKDYDVIVVGAGFAGPVAAKKCADAGLNVLMLERGDEVGDKVMSGLTVPLYGWLFGPSFIRDGDPPIERPVNQLKNYIIKNVETNDIDIDGSLKVPEPLGPVLPIGYNLYCKSFCGWEAKKAVESGVELRTSTVATDLIKDGGQINGIITDKGEKVTSKIVLDCEGSQGLLAKKAGMRGKWTSETISLGNAYDYEMKSAVDADSVFGYANDFLWAWDENKIAPPLGHGNGLMIFPYNNSFHYMQDQCLRTAEAGEPLEGANHVPNLRRLLDEYHDALTSKWLRWKNEIAPRVERLRGLIYDTMEIYVGLYERQRNIPISASGMLLVADAAGLESTELCDGVPTAWFSAEYAADVAIDAIRTGNTSAPFLKKYDEMVKSDGIIQWSTSGRDRYNLRLAQKNHDEELFKECIHHGWGAGIWFNLANPFLNAIVSSIWKDPNITKKWGDMIARYFTTWKKRGHLVEITYDNKDLERAWSEFLGQMGLPADARELEAIKSLGEHFIRGAKEGLG